MSTDYLATREFIKALHPDLHEGEYIELRGFRDNVKTVRLFVDSNDDDAIFTWIAEHVDTHNLFVGVNPRINNKTGKNEDIKRSRWVWIDIDSKKHNGATGEELLKRSLQRLVLPPHIVVYTGGGVHLYYRIVETEDLETVQTVCNSIADDLGGDPLGDASRVFRLPQTFNYKYDNSIQVTLAHCLVDYVYSLSDFTSALEIPLKVSKRVDTGDSRGFNSRSERDWSVVRALLSVGISEETVRYIFSKRAIGDKWQDEGDKYLDHTLAKAKERLESLIQAEDPNTPVQARRKVGRPKGSTVKSRWTIEYKDDCMFASDGEDVMKQLSTFAMYPKVLLQGDIDEGSQDTLLCDVVASGYTWEKVAFTRAAFNRVDSLTKQLPAMAWQWLGSDKDVRNLLPFLMDQLREQGLPKRKGTPIIGIHGNEFVSTSQTMVSTGLVDPDEAKMVWLPTQRVHPKLQLMWTEKDEVSTLLRQFTDLYFMINDVSVVYTVLGWYTAAFLKEKMATGSENARFPILNVFGTRGSGKTSLLTGVMQPLFCYSDPVAWDFDSTKFVMLSLLGSTNVVPISFAEYRRSSASNDQLERYIRMTYDREEDSRGRPDQTTQNYVLLAPFTVDGEDSVSDPACLERMIQINLHPETIAEGLPSYEAFQKVRDLPLGIIGTQLIAWLLDYAPRFSEALKLMHQVFPGALPDRVRRNLAIVTVGLQAYAGFAEYMDVEFPILDIEFLEAILSPSLSNVVNQLTGRSNLLVDDFIEDVIAAVAMSVDQRPPGFIFKYEGKDNTLYLNLSTSIKWWFKKRISERLQVVDSAAMKQQLKERMSKNGGGTTPGFYVSSILNKSIDGRPTHVYAIDVAMAEQSGLDVPEKLTKAIY